MRPPPTARGYFGLGVEGVGKPMNLSALLRTAHAFGASFAFAIVMYDRMLCLGRFG